MIASPRHIFDLHDCVTITNRNNIVSVYQTYGFNETNETRRVILRFKQVRSTVMSFHPLYF